MGSFTATTRFIKSLLGLDTVAQTPPNTGAGGGGAPVPANAFRGIRERVPEIVFIRERPGDGFLTSAKTYYELFGLNVRMVESIAEIVSILAAPGAVFQRIGLVSHAHPRGMIIPFFTNGVRGTNKEIFREFGKSDLDGLKLLSPFEVPMNHLFNWDSVITALMTLVRGRPGADALTPFGLRTTGNPPAGLRDFFRYCFDIVYLRNPGRVLRNTTAAMAGGITPAQRTILADFVGEILRQMSPGIETASSVTSAQVTAIRNLLTGLTYNQMDTAAGLGDFHPDLGLTDDSMNDFPTLLAVVPALTGGFRVNLIAARQRINAATFIDIRGCRAGQDDDYLEAIREFFGRGEVKPTVTAPRAFQAYPKIDRKRIVDRADLQSWIGSSQWGHTSDELKAAFRNWADLLRVTPLQTDFWNGLLRGQATRFGALSWRSQIPALFIPAPGLTELNTLNFAQIIGKLKDYFKVPPASVPNAAALTALVPVTDNLPVWGPQLLTPAADGATPAQRTTIFDDLKAINTALAQAFVPATSPSAPDPPTAVQLRGFQTALLNFLEGTRLTAIKTFMTAAADSLATGDGLFFYLVFSGVPTFVHGIPQLAKNGLVVLNVHRAAALQAWYTCLWNEPLPASGPYLTANIDTLDHRQVAALVGEDRTSYLSICPIPRYSHCIRKRPMPQGEDESLCGA